METEDELNAIRSAGNRFVRVESLDVDAAERAASYLFKNLDLCAKCLAHAQSKVCGGCGKLVGKNLKLNDALVLAHADALDKVTHLLTYDDRMIAMGQEMARQSLTVAYPIAATGIPVVWRRGRPQFASDADVDLDESVDSSGGVLRDDVTATLPPVKPTQPPTTLSVDRAPPAPTGSADLDRPESLEDSDLD